MRQVFDIQTSDPECLRCLASEMENSGLDPQISLLDQKPLLAFRSHERILQGQPARLIGGESRKRALAAEISQVKAQLRALNASGKELAREIDKAGIDHENLTNFKSFLNERTAEIRSFLQRGKEQEQNFLHCQLVFDQQEQVTETVQREVDSLTVRLAELRDLIAKEGLTNLERKINKIKNERQAIRETSDALKNKIGGDERDIKILQQKLQTLGEDIDSLSQQLRTAEATLRKILPEIDDLAHYILRTKKGQQFKSSDSITKKRDTCQVAALTGVEKIKMQLNHPEFAGAFRFSYEEDENELYDFCQQRLTSLIQQQTATLAEQQEVISERTASVCKTARRKTPVSMPATFSGKKSSTTATTSTWPLAMPAVIMLTIARRWNVSSKARRSRGPGVHPQPEGCQGAWGGPAGDQPAISG